LGHVGDDHGTERTDNAHQRDQSDTRPGTFCRIRPNPAQLWGAAQKDTAESGHPRSQTLQDRNDTRLPPPEQKSDTVCHCAWRLTLEMCWSPTEAQTRVRPSADSAGLIAFLPTNVAAFHEPPFRTEARSAPPSCCAQARALFDSKTSGRSAPPFPTAL